MGFEPVLTKGIGEVDLIDIDVYEGQGGYQGLRKALKSSVPPKCTRWSMSRVCAGAGSGLPQGSSGDFTERRQTAIWSATPMSEPARSTTDAIEYNPHQLIEAS